jgi:hypothetical protein
LHRARVALLLPPAVFGAVVFERQLPAFQFPSLAPAAARSAIMVRSKEVSCSKSSGIL